MRVVSAERLRDVARSAFWPLPSLCVAVAIGLAAGAIALDQQVGQTHAVFLFPGPPDGARTFLSAIVQAMIAFTGLVFSITMVLLQLTSSQFSPRVLRSFLRDRTIQLAFGVFVGTFVYAMVVLRAVRGTGGSDRGDDFVPRIAVTVTFVLVLLSVAVFIRYISHTANMIRLASIVAAIGDEARPLLERRHPTDAAPPSEATLPAGPVRTIAAPVPGVLVALNERALVEAAARAGVAVVLLPHVGDYLPAGAPLLHVHGDGRIAADELTGHLAFDIERTLEQDVAFPFRQLVDIAQKALSPGINDPTTATQALDIIHDLLRRLAGRQVYPGHHCDAGGALRLVVPCWTFRDLLDMSVGQIWRYGSDAAQVPERIARMLADLDEVALPGHRPAVRRWLEIVGSPADVLTPRPAAPTR